VFAGEPEHQVPPATWNCCVGCLMDDGCPIVLAAAGETPCMHESLTKETTAY
jgi:hypothetical protein